MVILTKLRVTTSCRYDVIENDLLGSLQLTTHHIAPYKSCGAERASEIEATDRAIHKLGSGEADTRYAKICPSWNGVSGECMPAALDAGDFGPMKEEEEKGRWRRSHTLCLSVSIVIVCMLLLLIIILLR